MIGTPDIRGTAVRNGHTTKSVKLTCTGSERHLIIEYSGLTDGTYIDLSYYR